MAFMQTPLRIPFVPASRLRLTIWGLVLVLTVAVFCLVLILDSKISISRTLIINPSVANTVLPPFPISVDPTAKTIDENPTVEDFMNNYVASNHISPSMSDSWFDRAVAKLANLDWYQNLATPGSRILIIQSGERQEEIAYNFARILRWSKDDQEQFSQRLQNEVPVVQDGKLYPGRYIVASDAGPDDVAIAVAERFDAEIRTRYTDELESTLPLREALIVASLIEREAYDFIDMRYISGVIWNRIFTDMRLQIDATLQYARGKQSAAAGGRWWPVPTSEDKYIDSPFNTYKHPGLPPEPIGNPSVDAIIAALNPRETDCLFYFHTDDGTFYCNATYEDHVAGLKQHFGQGK